MEELGFIPFTVDIHFGVIKTVLLPFWGADFDQSNPLQPVSMTVSDSTSSLPEH